MHVRLDKIDKRFGRARLVLDGIDLELAAGSFAYLRGVSGAGKSTLLGIVAGTIAPDAGRVHLDGREPWSEGEAAAAAFRRERVGIVFQTGRALPGVSLVENVALPLRFAGRRDALRRARAALADFGLARLGDALPDEVSVGELQRVCVVRALIAEPALVVADEPTSSLDVASADFVRSALRRAWQRGATVLVATHDERDLAAGDRVLTLHEGRLA